MLLPKIKKKIKIKPVLASMLFIILLFSSAAGNGKIPIQASEIYAENEIDSGIPVEDTGKAEQAPPVEQILPEGQIPPMEAGNVPMEEIPMAEGGNTPEQIPPTEGENTSEQMLSPEQASSGEEGNAPEQTPPTQEDVSPDDKNNAEKTDEKEIKFETKNDELSLAEGEIAVTQENFPDVCLLAFASVQDTNQDGRLQPDEAQKVTEFLYPNNGISDLKGLEYFTKIQKVDVAGNQITDFGVFGGLSEIEILKVSGNPALNLDVRSNQKLKRLIASNGALQNVTLSGLSDLEELYLNGNQLTSLDVSSLSSLRILTCSGNQLTSLNVSSCGGLETLQADHNRLTELHVAGLSKLKNLECQNNMISSIDFTGLDALTQLNVSNNQLTNLSVSNLGSLKTIFAGSNSLIGSFSAGAASVVSVERNGISELADTNAVTYLNCRKNQLSHLTLSSSGVRHVYCSDNQLSSLAIADPSGLISLYCENNHLSWADIGDHALDVRLSPQTTSLIRYKNGANHWSDLREAVGAERTMKTELAVGGDVLSYDNTNGIVYYGNAARSLTYQYLAGAGQGARMTVTAALRENDQTPPPTDSYYSPVMGNNTNISKSENSASGTKKSGKSKNETKRSDKEDTDNKNSGIPVITWDADQKAVKVVDENGKSYVLHTEKIGESSIQQLLEQHEELKEMLNQMEHQSWVEIHLKDQNGKEVQPSGNVQFLLNYPDGADVHDRFTVVHIEEGENPVKLEEGRDYLLSEEGILVTIDNFSPFIVAWSENEAVMETEEQAQTPMTSDDATSVSSEIVLKEKQERGVMGWFILIVLLLAAAGVCIYFYRMKGTDKKK